MPQFDFAHVVWPQLAWLAIFFAILYFGIVRMTLPKIADTVTAREDRIAGDVASAEAAKSAADSMAAAYTADIDQAQKGARQAMADAKAKAASSIEAAIAAGNVKIAERAAAAAASLAAAKASAFVEIETVAADAASDIVERLTGRKPPASLVASAAKSAMAV